MKRIVLSILMAAVAMVASAAVGDVFTYGYLKYSITKEATSSQDGTAIVLGLSEEAETQTRLVVTVSGRAQYNNKGYKVEKVPNTALRGKTNLYNVTIGWGIKEVEANAFDGCTSLQHLTITSSVTVIGANAFSGCKALSEVGCAIPYPDEVSIATNAFPSKSGMTLYVPNTNPNSEDDYLVHPAFSAFSSITASGKAHDGIATMGYYTIVTKAPSGSTRGEMTIVGFQSSIQHPNDFKPQDYEVIAGQRFNIVSICDGAFFNDSKLKVADFSKATNLKVIGNSAFYGSAIETLNLGTTLTEIDPRAFQNCQNLTTLSIPASVTTIGGGFVQGASNLKTIEVATENQNYASYNGVLYNKSRSQLIACPPGYAPESGNFLADLFPDELTTVGRDAFYQCDKIEMLEFPYGLKELNFCSVYKCANLLEVSLPSTVTAFNDCSFYKCANLNVVRCNATTPPSVNPNIEFSGAPRAVLRVPYESIDAYKAAPRWEGFSIYGTGSYDAPSKDMTISMEKYKVYYTIHSDKPETINGTAYDGRAKLSCVPSYSITATSAELSLPEYITVKGKKYAVTAVASGACPQRLSVDTKVKLGVNVDSICDRAFKDIPRIVGIKFDHNFTYLGNYAFDGCGISGELKLPYGLKHLGTSVFNNCPITHLLVPSSVGVMYNLSFHGLSSLKALVLNLAWPAYYETWNLSDIPTTCRLYVPTGHVNQYAQNPRFSKLNVTAGAFDITYDGRPMDEVGPRITFISNTPVTHDGVTYAGKAKYVYHPTHKSQSGTFFGSLFENYWLAGVCKKFLMVELGDSLLYDCKWRTAVNLTQMTGLERIGNYAFYGSGITSFTVPRGGKFIGEEAFGNCKDLKELILMPGSHQWSGRFYFNNHPDFKCYVKWDDYWRHVYRIKGWPKDESDPVEPADRFNAYVLVDDDHAITTFTVAHPVDWAASGLNAYTVKSYQKDEAKAYTQKVSQTPAGTGLLVDGYEKGKLYKLQRPASTPSAPQNLLVGAIHDNVDVFCQSGGFYFNTTDKCFWSPTSTYDLPRGYAFLKLPSADAGSVKKIEVDRWPQAAKGDVNGDGVVNVSDVTALINKILGTATYTDAVCDINADGQVNVSDVTALINMLLG
ncbi:MAG: leucine-rich repeat protein [Bacteroidales bacterium]|nr:leucine-rich repeat protein [Bacteroidales bacterium]